MIIITFTILIRPVYLNLSQSIQSAARFKSFKRTSKWALLNVQIITGLITCIYIYCNCNFFGHDSFVNFFCFFKYLLQQLLVIWLHKHPTFAFWKPEPGTYRRSSRAVMFGVCILLTAGMHVIRPLSWRTAADVWSPKPPRRNGSKTVTLDWLLPGNVQSSRKNLKKPC